MTEHIPKTHLSVTRSRYGSDLGGRVLLPLRQADGQKQTVDLHGPQLVADGEAAPARGRVGLLSLQEPAGADGFAKGNERTARDEIR
jgi:hypothetical protein